MEYSNRPSKAEELFYFLKKLAGARGFIYMEEVRLHFPNPTALSAFYSGIKKLEEIGAVERIMDGNLRGNRLAGLNFLKDEVSLPQGKRGRKLGSKNTKKEALPPVQIAAPQASSAPASEQALARIVTPPASSVFVPKQKPLEVSIIHRSRIVARPVTSPRTVVFIDENQLIMSDLEGRKFSLDLVLEKIKQATGEKIERVFIYCSEATEKKNLPMVQNLFRLDSQLVRFVKTGSQPGVVDKRIGEDIELWSRIDFVSTIVLGTADGGLDFLAAIAKVKESSKKLFLLKTGGSFNTALRQLADALIDGTSSNQRQRSFEEIIVAAADGDFSSGDLNSRFVLAVAMGLKNFFKSGKDAKFVEIVQYIQTIIRARKEFDGYTAQDLRAALSVLLHKGRLLTWRTESGNKVFRLAPRCALLDALAEFVPASMSV